MVPNKLSEIDPRSGFCKSNSIFYSKRRALSLPEKDCLDVTTFISCQPHRGRTAFIDAATGQELTFKQLWTAVDSVATGLSELGVRKGQVVLVLSPNSIFLPIVYLSVMSLGAIITTTNPLNTPREIARQIADCNPSLVFTTLRLVPKLAPYNSSLPIILMDDQNDYKGRILTTFWDMIKKPPRNRVTSEDVVFQDDIATLLYSSGTTGQSKGVMSSHRNMIAMTQSLVERIKLDERERITVCTVPMFHTYGLSISTCHPALGSTIVVLSKFDLHEMLWAVQRYKATDLPLVPPILVAMVNGANEIKSKYDLSSLKSVLCGGAPLSKDMIEGFLEKYPTVQFRQGYALTESNGGGASTDTTEECRRYGTAGLLTGSLEAKIVDPETGKALPVNRTGELWLRGPYIMKEQNQVRGPESGYPILRSEIVNYVANAGDTMVDPRSGFCKANSIFYSKRLPIPLPKNEFLDVTTFISSQAHHGTVAFIDAATDRHVTFADLWKAVDSVASGISEMGVRKGDVILLLSPNSLFFPIVCLAVMSLGAIITTTNPLNTPREIAKQIGDSKPSFAFTTLQLVPKLLASNTNLPIILLDDDERSTTVEAKVVTTLMELMKKDPIENRVRERIHQDDTATLLYSSGTTGASKGVVSSHRNLIAMVQTVLGRFIEETDLKYICTVPMFHIYGLAAFATGLLASGATIIVLSKFEMEEMLSAIQRYRATDLPLVPPILVGMINASEQIKSNYDLSSLQTVLSGGAPLNKEVIEGFVSRYPNVKIQQGYGLTESTGIGAATQNLEESRRYGTAGLLAPSMEAKIVDPDSGKALPVNQTGELWLRGPTIMKGYFGNVEATSSTLDSEGWLRTGDLCYIDDDGFIFVVDRLKELIKYKGYQVPPAELEALLLSHPDISDAAVIPFPDKEVGQFPMAYIVRKPGSSLYESAVMNFIAKQVAPYKRIRKVAFVDAIPKNPSGKILRKDLIKLATSKL